jgi:hypothetical protein
MDVVCPDGGENRLKKRQAAGRHAARQRRAKLIDGLQPSSPMNSVRGLGQSKMQQGLA